MRGEENMPLHPTCLYSMCACKKNPVLYSGTVVKLYNLWCAECHCGGKRGNAGNLPFGNLYGLTIKLLPKSESFLCHLSIYADTICSMFSVSLHCWLQWWSPLSVCSLLRTKYSLLYTFMSVYQQRRSQATKGASWEKQWDKGSDAQCNFDE